MYSPANPCTQTFGYAELVKGHVKYSPKYLWIVNSSFAKSPTVDVENPSKSHDRTKDVQHVLAKRVQLNSAIIRKSNK
jgi:hypothetical protein